MVEHWSSLDQEMVNAFCVNAFKGMLDKLRQGPAFSWANLLSPQPHGMIDSPVRPPQGKILGKVLLRYRSGFISSPQCWN